jgi:hypothetical protein
VGVLNEQTVCINNWNYSHLNGGGGLTLCGGRLRQDETSVRGGEREREERGWDVLGAMQICYCVLEGGWEEAAWRE